MNIKTLLILGIVVFILTLFGAGFFFGHLFKENNPSIGCWKQVIKTNRSIAIQVDTLSIEEIINTARHEICHEIYFREFMNYTYNKSRENENEKFARTCNPKDYLNKYNGG